MSDCDNCSARDFSAREPKEPAAVLTEVFDIVDENGNVIGTATREECHGNPSLIHQTVHVLVFNSRGELFLQKRSPDKDIQPGKWDTSVGGHLGAGEACEKAARREMEEELGIKGARLEFLYRYLMRNEIESELVTTFRCVWDGAITVDPKEISEGRFWSFDEIESALGSGIFTPNFEDEFARYKDLTK